MLTDFIYSLRKNDIQSSKNLVTDIRLIEKAKSFGMNTRDVDHTQLYDYICQQDLNRSELQATPELIPLQIADANKINDKRSAYITFSRINDAILIDGIDIRGE